MVYYYEMITKLLNVVLANCTMTISRVYGVGGKLFKTVHSFYVDSRASVRVGNDVSEWFPVNVGLTNINV